MWFSFNSRFHGEYWDYGVSGCLFAVKISTGKINAVTGEVDTTGLKTPQNYLIVPKQPWLDGYCVKKGVIRQFVAMSLGVGYSAEEQITGKGENGGLQIIKREVFEELFPHKEKGDVPLPENTSVTPDYVIKLRAGFKKNQVREEFF
ncbi:MAG: hypothetical protein WDA18_09720 [Candidatus Ratteibacteria bacterium]|jgi:hypothetical protein